MDSSTPESVYRAEKAKALRDRRISHVQLMAEAKEAFRKLLADAAIARKGGRPKSATNAAGGAKPLVAKPAAAAAAPAAESAKPAAKTATSSTSTKPALQLHNGGAKAGTATRTAKGVVKKSARTAAPAAKVAPKAKPTQRAAARVAKVPSAAAGLLRAKNTGSKSASSKSAASKTPSRVTGRKKK